MTSSAARGIPYPQRHLGRALERVLARIASESPGLKSGAAVARWLGFPERSKFNKWVKGRLLPSGDSDIRRLAKLGLDEDEIRSLIALDRLAAFSIDEELTPGEMIVLVADMARTQGMTEAEIIEHLSETDVEELERQTAPRSRRERDR